MAGTHSGVGKTTVATGLMAALRNRGVAVRAAKVGPDYIDPGYHRLATGAASRNLDTFLQGRGLVATLAARAASGGDLLVIEGVMGLFDGAGSVAGAAGSLPGSPGEAALPLASSAEMAVLTGSPVLLVVDAAAMSQSVAALVHGFATFGPAGLVQGVVLNKVGSDAHEAGLRRALEPLGIPVLGALRRDPALTWRDRHLGLVPVAERAAELAASIARLGDAVARAVDLDAVMRLARGAGPLPQGDAWRPAAPGPPGARTGPAAARPGRPRVAVAGGPAFSFVYPETLERLEEAGAEVVPFDPLADGRLPEALDGLYAGGGFPEVYAEALAANGRLLGAVARFAAEGGPIWAECGGLLFLASSLDGRPLCGVVRAAGTMGGRLTLGYRRAVVRTPNPVAGAGARLVGHEFHYSSLEPAGEALELDNGTESWLEGHAGPSLLATYLHQHLAADPAPAERFVAASATWGALRRAS